MPFVKLDTGILDSTLWLSDPEVRIVFITMLAMAGRGGMVEATAPGIARRANLSLETVRAALSELEAPDPDSRTLADDGRRVRRVDGGYQITNYEKYRQKDHTRTERQRRHREKQKSRDDSDLDSCNGVTGVTERRDVTTHSASASASSSESGSPDDESSSSNQTTHRFEDWWAIYPAKRKKKEAREVWKRKNLDTRADELIADVQRREAEDRQWLEGYIPHPTTYLRGERWEDEINRPGNRVNGSGAAKEGGSLDGATPF